MHPWGQHWDGSPWFVPWIAMQGALITIQVGFSEQPPSMQADMVGTGVPREQPRVWLDIQTIWLPQELNCSNKVQRMGNGQGMSLVPSHFVPPQPTHLSIRIASVLRSFSSHVSFSSAMIFSVSWQGRVKEELVYPAAAHLPTLPRSAQHASTPKPSVWASSKSVHSARTHPSIASHEDHPAWVSRKH